MKIRNILSAIFLLAMGQGCVESVGFAFPESNAKLVLMAEFSPDADFSVEISTSVTPCCDDEITFPDDAQVELFEDDVLLGLLSKDRNSNRYILEASHQPKESSKYVLKAWLADHSVDPVRTETIIPKSNSLSNIEIIAVDSLDSGALSLQIRLFFDEPETFPAYFHIIPSRRKNSFTIDPVSGEPIITYSNEMILIDIIQVVSQSNAAFELNHLPGFIVDFAKLDAPHIDLKLSTKIDFEEELFRDLILGMSTVSPDYYFYHKAISQSSSANGATVPKPINIPSNIENGLGLFAGINTKLDSFQIQ